MARPRFSMRNEELRLNGRKLRDTQHLVSYLHPRSALEHGDPAIVELVSSGRAGAVVDAVATGEADLFDLTAGDPLAFFSLVGGCWPSDIGIG